MFKGLFGQKFQENWRGTADKAGLADKLGVIGVGLSQLSAGQAPNILPAWQAVEDRRAKRKLTESLGNPELLAGFTPEQQKMLSVMPPELAQSLIMEKMFAPPPDPMDAIALEKAQLELAQMKAPNAVAPMSAEDKAMWGLGEGTYVMDPKTKLPTLIEGTAPSADASYGTTLQFWTDEQGKTRAGVLGNNGELKEVPPPGGGDWALGIEKIDLGTKYQIRDKRSGAILGEEPKDLRGEAAETVRGKAEGEAMVAAPADVATADATLGYIESLRNHPGREAGTGMDSFRSAIPGTEARDFAIENQRLSSGAFMTAIEQLRGMGALSNAEGQTATAAVAALATEGTEEGYLKRLAEYEEIVKRGRERAMNRLKYDGSPMDGGAAAPEELSDEELLKLYGGE